MASPIQHENVKGEKVAALPHSIKVAAKASDVKSVRQVGTDIIITLHSGQQIVLPDAALRALTDPQLTLLFEDQDVLASALLNPGSELAAVQAAPLAAPEPAVAAPAEASAPAPAAPSQAELAPPAPTAQLAQDQYLGTLDPAAAAKSDSGFALWPWLLAGGLAGAAIPGGGGNTTNNTPTTPVITNVSISGTTAGNPAGIQNHTLTAGDTVIISVTLSEVFKLSAVPAKAALSASPQPHANAASDNSGLPTLTLKIGDTLVQATCDVTGSRDNILLFKYTIQKGDNDSHGISIVGDSLSLNGCTLTNTGGTAALIVFEDVLSNVNCLVDTAAPNVVSVVMSHDTVGLDNSSQVTVTLSEAVNAFDKSNVSVQNGSLGAFTPNSDHTQWSATFTPTPGKEASGNVVKMVEIPVFTDLAGNTGTDSTSASDGYRIDTVRPTATITMADSSVAGSQTRQVSFTFSEAVTDFKATDLNVPNGTLTDPVSTDGGTNWSATFTPKANTAVAGNVITLSANSVFDVAGNANRNANGEATPSNEYSVNTITLTISGLSNASVAEHTDYTSVPPSVSGAVGAIIYSLQGDDAALFTVAADGVVRMAARDYETPADVGKDNLYNYTLTATDANGSVATQAVVVAVTNVNEAPTVATPLVDQTATQNTALHYTFDLNTFADLDALTTLSYSATLDSGANLPSWLSFDAVTGSFSGTPLNADVGTISVKVTASDGALTASDSFSIAVANVNDAPSGAVTITGTPTQGQVLTAHNTLADADGLGTVSYSWFADSVAISGATASTYMLTQAEVGKAITVAVSYTDGHGTPESVLSGASTPVANINDPPGGAVTISGTPTQSQTLTANHNLTDIDGLGATIAYRWFADDTATSGVGNQYTLTQAEVGKAITVRASYTDGFGYNERVFSAATQDVLNVNDPPTGGVFILGEAKQGVTLTASNTLADADGIASGAISYNWFANGADTGITGTTYTLAQTDVSKVFTVNASYTDGFGYAESKTSGATAAVTGTAPPTSDTTAPQVAFIQITDTALKIDDTANVTITFSEAVTLGASAVSMPDCTLVDPWTTYDSGLSWYASYTPNDGVENGNLALTVGTDFTDLAGNTGVGKSKSYSIDTIAPTVVSITIDKDTIGFGQTAIVTFEFRDAVSGFAINDINAPYGTLSGLAAKGGGTADTSWKATFEPSDNIERSGNFIQLWGDSVRDAAGNANVGTYTSTDPYQVSSSVPTLTIGSTATGLRGGQAVIISFNFSADPVNFDANDIVVNGGTLTGLTTSGAIRYATFTANSTVESATINVLAENYTVNGHPGVAGHLLQPILIDHVAPVSVNNITYNTGPGDTDFGTHDAIINASEAAAGFRIYGTKAEDANVSLTDQQIIVDSPTTWHVVLTQDSIFNAYGQGPERLVFTSTDAVGNFSTTAINLTVDTVGPTFSSPGVGLLVDTNGAGIASGAAVYTASSAEAGVIFSLGALPGQDPAIDNGLFQIDAVTGVVKFGDGVATQTYLSPGDAGGNHVYDFSVIATDTNGSGSTQAVHLTLGANKIAVYTSETVHDTSTWVGNLIAPVMVDGGDVYYYWDYSGNGTATNVAGTEPVTGVTTSQSSDWLTSSDLKTLFNHTVDYSGTADVDPSHTTANLLNEDSRYAYLYTRDGTPLHVAVPSGTPLAGNKNPAGTLVGTFSPTSAGSVEINTTYDGMTAIWDAYNGTGLTAGAATPTSARINGLPPDWGSATAGIYFLTATPISATAYYQLIMAWGVTDIGVSSCCVALQVL